MNDRRLQAKALERLIAALAIAAGVALVVGWMVARVAGSPVPGIAATAIVFGIAAYLDSRRT